MSDKAEAIKMITEQVISKLKDEVQYFQRKSRGQVP